MRLSLVFLAVLALGLTSVSASVTNCKNESSILIYGSFVNYETQTQWPQWLRDNIPGAVVNFPDAMPTITLDLLSPYDLVVFANLRARTLSADEVAATNSYFQAGGAAICLAGWTNDNEDIAAQEQIFGGLGIHYDNTTLISLQETVGSWNFNPNNPLTQGLGNGWMHFRGGRATTPYTGAGTSTIFASGISLYDPNTYSIGQTVVLPSGGKVVLWGDEWALFVGLYSQPGCVDAQFWKNAVAWASDICVPGAQVSPCDTKKVFGSSCTSISHSENSKGFTLTFSSSATNCD